MTFPTFPNELFNVSGRITEIDRVRSKVNKSKEYTRVVITDDSTIENGQVVRKRTIAFIGINHYNVMEAIKRSNNNYNFNISEAASGYKYINAFAPVEKLK